MRRSLHTHTDTHTHTHTTERDTHTYRGQKDVVGVLRVLCGNALYKCKCSSACSMTSYEKSTDTPELHKKKDTQVGYVDHNTYAHTPVLPRLLVEKEWYTWCWIWWPSPSWIVVPESRMFWITGVHVSLFLSDLWCFFRLFNCSCQEGKSKLKASRFHWRTIRVIVQ
jgi:hypothetical protein